jgi:hypothetical protein
MDLKVLPSSIDGVGLFSLIPITKNKKITDYIGKEMSLTEFSKRYGPYKENCLNTYRMKRVNKIIVAKEEPHLSNNLVNYINESVNPNCVLKKRALYSLQDIPIGTELTLRYPVDYCRNYKIDLQS